MATMEVDIYARISDDQADDAHGTDNQIADCQAYAAEHGWAVVDVYRDDSISATKGRLRPGYEAVLQRPIKRPILVWHIDRLVRVSADLERVIEQDLTVHAIHAGLIDLSTAAGKAVARTVTAWSTYEGEIKAKRQISANKAIAAAGRPRWRVRPYGHTLDGSLVPEEAAVLREAAERVLSGHSVRSVRTWLRTIPGAPVTNVGRLLRSPRLAGHNVYNGERINVSNIAPILDEETYSDVVRLLSDPARATSGMPKGKVSTLLTGIARCGICDDGSTMHARTEVKRGVNVAVYRCAAKGHNQHRRDLVDSVIVARTFALLGSPEGPDIIQRHSSTPQSVKEELAELRSQLAEWEAVGADLGAVEYMKVTKPIRDRLKVLEEISRQTSHRALFEGLGFSQGMDLPEAYKVQEAMRERWDSLPLLKRREIIATLWDVTIKAPDRPKGVASFWSDSKVVTSPK